MKREYTQAEIMDALVRGIMIGGSVGALGGLFFLDMRRAFVLGLISGFLAAITKLRMKKGGDGGDTKGE